MKLYGEIFPYILTAMVLLGLMGLSINCTETLDKEVTQKDLYVLSSESPILILPDSEIQIQFIEVFDSKGCKKGTVCNEFGIGKVMIGISGPGLMPFPTELKVGIGSNALFGYSIIIDHIDRTEIDDQITIIVNQIATTD
ncbi:MAG: hypothetical protein DK302_001395 [Chloroflexi bacterium]|jgi:hypothetical protein|nr:MAG: hypothetical protein DK302_001395 [Chloroflexota bacterium]